jgi:hypothetical protein
MGSPLQPVQPQQPSVRLEAEDDNLLASTPHFNKQECKMPLIVLTCAVAEECLLEWGLRLRFQVHQPHLCLRHLQDHRRREQMLLGMLQELLSIMSVLI